MQVVRRDTIAPDHTKEHGERAGWSVMEWDGEQLDRCVCLVGGGVCVVVCVWVRSGRDERCGVE